MPFKVSVFVPTASVPDVSVSMPLIALLAWSVTPLELLIFKLLGPPEEGNSVLVVVCADEPAYSNVEDAPYVNVKVLRAKLAVPAIVKVPFTVMFCESVFVLLPFNNKSVYAVGFAEEESVPL